MNDVLGHHLILVAAATAICTMSYVSGWPRRPVQPEPEVAAIVIVPQTEPRSRAPSVRVPEVPVPQDMASLSREIQRELKRLGCYDGELNGKWNASSRQAMKSLADQVNAKLPVDRPDYILLRLAQGQQGRPCAVPKSKTSLPSPPSLLREGHTPEAGARTDQHR
jgi:hypothetical protein